MVLKLFKFFFFLAKILFFYLIFYSALCGFFAAMLAVFYTTLNDKMPKWQLDSSLIGTNPGNYRIIKLLQKEFKAIPKKHI